jgi:hypothetical protein
LLGKVSTTWTSPPVLFALAYLSKGVFCFCPAGFIPQSSCLYLLSSWDYRCASSYLALYQWFFTWVPGPSGVHDLVSRGSVTFYKPWLKGASAGLRMHFLGSRSS